MQLSTYCQNSLHCMTAIFLLYFLNTSNSAYLRGRRRHYHDNIQHTEEHPPSVVAEPAYQTVDQQQESSSVPYSVREDEDMSNNTNTPQQLCPSCQLREHQKALRIESIKRMILDKLRMQHAPNISRPTIPTPLAHLVNRSPELNDMQGDDPQITDGFSQESPATDATTQKMYTFAKRCKYLNFFDLRISLPCNNDSSKVPN